MHVYEGKGINGGHREAIMLLPRHFDVVSKIFFAGFALCTLAWKSGAPVTGQPQKN